MIASEFPGQFPGKELYNLDIRDERFFTKEARKKQILREANLLNSIRLATLADRGSFARKIYELERELNELEGIKTSETTMENWEDLKIKGRG